MRAKLGITDTENVEDIGNTWCMAGVAATRHGKLSDSSGMKRDRSVELPKLDVAGSIPVARANCLSMGVSLFRWRVLLRAILNHQVVQCLPSISFDHVGRGTHLLCNFTLIEQEGFPDLRGIFL